MEVKELIEKLQEMPQDAEVRLGNYTNAPVFSVFESDDDVIII